MNATSYTPTMSFGNERMREEAHVSRKGLSVYEALTGAENANRSLEKRKQEKQQSQNGSVNTSAIMNLR